MRGIELNNKHIGNYCRFSFSYFYINLAMYNIRTVWYISKVKYIHINNNLIINFIYTSIIV